MNLLDSFKRFLKNNILLVLLLSLAVLVIGITFRDYGISWDERDNLDLGEKTLSYYMSLGSDKTYFNYYPQKEFYATRGPFVEVIRAFIFEIFNRDTIGFYHLILAIFALPAFYFVYKTIYLITKNKLMAAFAFLFLLLMPRFWGDIFNNSKDISVGVLLSIIIFLSVKILNNLKNVRFFDLFLLGMFSGLIVSLRVIGLYILLLFVVFYLVNIFINKEIKIKKQLINLFFLIFVFLFFLHLFTPYLHIKPIIGIYDMVVYAKLFPWVGEVLFDGGFVMSNNLPWYYLPRWILITTPLVFLILFVVLIVFVIFQKNRNYKEKLFIKTSSLFVILSFCVPILITVAMRPIIYDAWRHFLFLSIPLVLGSSLGLDYLINYLNHKKMNRLALPTYFVVCLCLGTIVCSYLKLHPYEYSYFNSLVGGLKGAYGKYETDYWGKSMKESVDWLKVNSKNTPIKIYACAHPFQTSHYLLENMSLIGNINEADYYICYTRNNEHLKISNEKTVHIVSRDGVPLNYIKKIK